MNEIVRYIWRPLLVIAAFLGVGYGVATMVTTMSSTSSTPMAQIRLASMMAGLFAGGAAALLVMLALSVWWRRK